MSREWIYTTGNWVVGSVLTICKNIFLKLHYLCKISWLASTRPSSLSNVPVSTKSWKMKIKKVSIKYLCLRWTQKAGEPCQPNPRVSHTLYGKEPHVPNKVGHHYCFGSYPIELCMSHLPIPVTYQSCRQSLLRSPPTTIASASLPTVGSAPRYDAPLLHNAPIKTKHTHTPEITNVAMACHPVKKKMKNLFPKESALNKMPVFRWCDWSEWKRHVKAAGTSNKSQTCEYRASALS